MKIISVVGARPNFMKIAPFIKAIKDHNLQASETIDHILVHTGQHYDDRMSTAFFEALEIPPADINLEIGSGSHAEQVGNTMIAFEKVLLEEMPEWVVVVGDVNATLACSVAAKKLHIKVCHIEAGLRSGDIKMPEEVNRLVTDRLSDLLLTPDRISIENLKQEGTSPERISFVGNIMIDTLETHRERAAAYSINEIIENNQLEGFKREVGNEDYAVVTLHRPSNVDEKEILIPIVNFLLEEVTTEMPILWPVHPRTRKNLEDFGLWEKISEHPEMIMLHPLGYHEMLRLNMEAKIMITDSGGLQEECTILGTPCLTLRWNTERPITLKEHGGASVLVGNHIQKIREEYLKTLTSEKKVVVPELWDGKTAQRCLDAILNFQSE
ncbi:UDP-N-acetylglucosamine 2-epimerase (non-hydrolyzing) [Salinimicrobium marinum]|uniref:UDP-N-acetylglucosamine 2-epimerase (Non-hydrolyzing) n=1 Tax=Salinimicrobium marinum TaxID=680283 RepID=A0A918W1U5_9FLAO|nr:UDP-N-acetylglucosamine 2-epimerase (non-hydrolyzing) [Salinimicrobium marinum]GHA46092.1 UDP-N-acetylglucosamine 2-epimerase (non-hydrolyzing) [Salinimicrobium marinum]